ncbi:MAG: phosphoribosylformylglycinamidine synthase subunit PurQ [Pikeienuella sp.]
MKTAVIVFPGSNCDRDMAVALGHAAGRAPAMVWHKDAALPEGLDMVAVPGGFSFGDYLRCGAIAARSPIMRAVAAFAEKGGIVLGVCNGFQVLIEAGLLPGALMRNSGLKFTCRDTHLRVETSDSPFTNCYQAGETIALPIAHHDGNYIADAALLDRLEGEGRVAFRYVGADGAPSAAANPNGSSGHVAGVLSANRRVLGMMPHPERAAEAAHGGMDGARLFESLAGVMAV